MIIPSDNGSGFCEHCCLPMSSHGLMCPRDIQEGGNAFIFKIQELRAIGRLLNFHYIPYDDLEAHQVVRRVFDIINNYDKPRQEKECQHGSTNSLPNIQS